jgi:hypothetical protein
MMQGPELPIILIALLARYRESIFCPALWKARLGPWI